VNRFDLKHPASHAKMHPFNQITNTLTQMRAAFELHSGMAR
jgi:hypothetical protein